MTVSETVEWHDQLFNNIIVAVMSASRPESNRGIPEIGFVIDGAMKRRQAPLPSLPSGLLPVVCAYLPLLAKTMALHSFLSILLIVLQGVSALPVLSSSNVPEVSA